jgi:hypothetical protein
MFYDMSGRKMLSGCVHCRVLLLTAVWFSNYGKDVGEVD